MVWPPVSAGRSDTWFGPVQTPVSAGHVDSVATLNTTKNLVEVTVGGKPATVTFAGEILAGLYLINIVVPQVPGGDNLLVATIPTAPNTLLFPSDTTQNCRDSDPHGAIPKNCNVYLAVQ